MAQCIADSWSLRQCAGIHLGFVGGLLGIRGSPSISCFSVKSITVGTYRLVIWVFEIGSSGTFNVQVAQVP